MALASMIKTTLRDKKYLSMLILRSLCLLFVLANEAQAQESDQSIDAAINKLIQAYYPVGKSYPVCKGWFIATGYCLNVDRQQIIDTQEGKRLYVLVTGDVIIMRDGKPIPQLGSGHVDNGLTGVFVLKPYDNNWLIESSNAFISAGVFGKGLRDWKLIEVAPDKWGFVNRYSDSHGVQSGTAYLILVPQDNTVVKSRIEASYEQRNAIYGSLSCGDDSVEYCDKIESTIKVDRGEVVDGFYPIELLLNGELHGKTYKNESYKMYYQLTGGYYVLEYYPLKDISF